MRTGNRVLIEVLFSMNSSKMSTSLCVCYSGFEVVFSACKFQSLLPLEACGVYVL